MSRSDARLPLAAAVLLQAVVAAWGIHVRTDAGHDPDALRSLAWVVVTAALAWAVWARRSAVARWVLVLTTALPLILLLAATNPVQQPRLWGFVVPGVAQLALLCAPSVRERTARRVDLETY